MNLHSPIKVWREGENQGRIHIKIEALGVLLSVSSSQQSKQYERLEEMLSGGLLPDYIVYGGGNVELLATLKLQEEALNQIVGMVNSEDKLIFERLLEKTQRTLERMKG